MSWRIGQEYQRVSNGYTGAEHFGFLFSGQGKFALEAYKVSTGGLPKVEKLVMPRVRGRRRRPLTCRGSKYSLQGLK
ncbi:hypothetical protein EV361DRAFT_957043 [Lentinula raphanica]|nr:hypothetical protein EV361DRAFT_957043 [Lentinula raphanica]